MAHVTMPLGNKKNIAAAINYYTRWIKATIVTNKMSQSIMSFDEQKIFMRTRSPRQIKTDGRKLYILTGIVNFLLNILLFMKSQHLTILRVMVWLSN